MVRAMSRASAPHDDGELGRLHLVFVPGFGGFDALGELEYYAGTTDVFQAWCAEGRGDHWGDRVVAHYFDTLPSAGVRTRARLLREYLTAGVKRHEFRVGADRVALIAHSTGCLDVRQLLADLDACRSQPTSERGTEARSREHVEGETLLGLISRVVFLSAPQRGSNLADWVRTQPVSARAATLSMASTFADGLDFPLFTATHQHFPWLFDATSKLVFALLKGLGGTSGFLQAFEDVGREISKIRHDDPWISATSRMALAKIQLYLDQTEGDFLAIDDLSCDPSTPHTKYGSSLARASESERAQELARWHADGIAVRCYATRGRNPFAMPPQKPSKLAPLHRVLWALRARSSGGAATDAPYRLAYMACASGPFVPVEREATHFVTRALERIESWHNDGIVNTASMLWPNGAATLLVDADHGDLIGHFEEGFAEGAQAELRTRVRYDIFGSSSGFDRALFEAVWFDILSFCASAPRAKPIRKGASA
jgi:triacylglycerol lipase